VSSQPSGLVAVAGLAFVLCLVGIVVCIVKLVAGNRGDLLASASLVGEAPLHEPEAERVEEERDRVHPRLSSW